jgi:hypothetical protein
MAMLGQPPSDPAQRESWRCQVAIVAAYRDQHRVVSSDPRQVLGPYPEAGHAGHGPYWHAAEAVLAARRAAGLDAAPDNGKTDATAAQIAADVYRALPEDERAAIARTIAADASVLWLGNPDNPDEEAVVQPDYAYRLAEKLVERGHLNPHAPAGRPAPARVPATAQYPSPRIPLQRPEPWQQPSGPVPGR